MVCEFSVPHYLETIDDYKSAGYKFIPVSMIDHHVKTDSDERVVAMRHDVDISLDFACDLADEEHPHLTSTYYVLLHCPVYNPLNEDGVRAIQRIARHGHEIGLQVDTRFTWDIANEIKVLSRVANSGVSSYAQHFVGITPDLIPNVYGAHPCHINAMDYANKNGVKYISDSGKHWREGCFCNHIGKHERIQILTHPVWWIHGDKTRAEALQLARKFEKARMVKNFSAWDTVLNTYLAQFGATIHDTSSQPAYQTA